MSLAKIFESKAFIPYITAGDPNLEQTQEWVLGLEKLGASLIELGVPFSDSIADGPVIQNSFLRALEQGVNLDKIFRTIEKIRLKSSVPLLLMCSYHLLYTYPLLKAIHQAARYQVEALLAPELPIEEAEEFSALCKSNGVEPIFLVAPSSSPERIKKIGELTGSFVYLLARAGITGEQSELLENLSERIDKVRQITGKPVAVGFGISSADQVKKVSQIADGVIVGSSIVKYQGESPEKLIDWARELIEGMK